MKSGRVLYVKSEEVYIVKFVGNVRLTLCSEVDQFLQEIFKREDYEDILIDLTEADGCDSTTLGLIAQTSIHLQQAKEKKPTLLIADETMKKIIQAVCFQDFFHVIEKPSPSCTEAYIEPEANLLSKKEMGTHMLEAHKTLARLSEINREQFQDVIELLEEEVASL